MPQAVENLAAVQEAWVCSLRREDPLERRMATPASMLAWRTPWTEEPGGLQSTGSQSQTRLSDYRLRFFTFRERKHVGKADKPTKSDASFPQESLWWTLETVPAVTAGGGWPWRTAASRDQGFRCAGSSAQEASQRSFPEPKRHSATVSVARAVQAAAFSAQAPAEPLASLQATGKSVSPSGCQGPHL